MSADGLADSDSFERCCRVTLMFADLSDYTSLSENSDSEEIADICGCRDAIRTPPRAALPLDSLSDSCL